MGGFFSDLYYDRSNNVYYGLSDREPGGGTIPYDTRVQKFTLNVNPNTGAISNFNLIQTILFTNPNQTSPPPISTNLKALWMLQDPLVNEGLNPGNGNNDGRYSRNLRIVEFDTAQEIGEIYQQRWQIELLWKFLKMYLKLDRIITKNENGIRIQIYSCLIAYLLLQLIEIPQELGKTLLDKLRYLQAHMCQEISHVHWFRKLIWLS